VPRARDPAAHDGRDHALAQRAPLPCDRPRGVEVDRHRGPRLRALDSAHRRRGPPAGRCTVAATIDNSAGEGRAVAAEQDYKMKLRSPMKSACYAGLLLLVAAPAGGGSRVPGTRASMRLTLGLAPAAGH